MALVVLAFDLWRQRIGNAACGLVPAYVQLAVFAVCGQQGQGTAARVGNPQPCPVQFIDSRAKGQGLAVGPAQFELHAAPGHCREPGQPGCAPCGHHHLRAVGDIDVLGESLCPERHPVAAERGSAGDDCIAIASCLDAGEARDCHARHRRLDLGEHEGFAQALAEVDATRVGHDGPRCREIARTVAVAMGVAGIEAAE